MKALNAVYTCTLAGAIIASTVIVQCAEAVAAPGLQAVPQDLVGVRHSGPSFRQSAQRPPAADDRAKQLEI